MWTALAAAWNLLLAMIVEAAGMETQMLHSTQGPVHHKHQPDKQSAALHTHLACVCGYILCKVYIIHAVEGHMAHGTST